MINMFVFISGLVVGVIFDRYMFKLALTRRRELSRTPQYNAYLLNRYNVRKKY